MNYKELQQKVKRLEEEIINLKLKLEEKKPYEVEVPKDVGDNYFIGEYGNIYSLEGCNMNLARIQYRLGLAFKTEEEAEQHLKESILLFKLRKWAEEHNEGWTVNWNERDVKYFVEYEFGKFLIKFNTDNRTFTKLPYFKSEEIAREFVKVFRDEIIEVLC